MARLPKLTRAERARIRAVDRAHIKAVQATVDAVDRAGSVLVDLYLRRLIDAAVDDERGVRAVATRALAGTQAGVRPWPCGCCGAPLTLADLREAMWFTIRLGDANPLGGLLCPACTGRPDLYAAMTEGLLGPCWRGNRLSLTHLEPRGNA